MTVTDRNLIEQVAQVWIAGGGDSEGIGFLWQDIRDRIKELEDDRASLSTPGDADAPETPAAG